MNYSNSTRTDVHAPKSLVTEDYQFAACIDLGGTGQDAGEAAGYRVMTINMVVIEPKRQWANVHPYGQCDHCGAHIRYAALMIHTPTNTVLMVGETCLDNRFSRATGEFQALRKQAELDRQAQRIKHAVAEFAEKNPDVAFLATGELPEFIAWNNFVREISGKLRMYGELSQAQVQAVRNSVTKAQVSHAAREARKATEAARPVVDCPTGRLVITGTVEFTKWYENDFGGTLKMRVADDSGFKVFGSVPSALDVKSGDRVSFTATITPSDKDKSFGFYSRPSKAKLA